MIGVILAAGRGSRLDKISAFTSKPALPLLGKSLLRRVHETFALYLDPIVIVINPNDQYTIELLGNPYWKQANLQIVEQARPLGSAHALKHAWRYVDDACIVTGCDNIIGSDFMAQFYARFVADAPDAQVALYAIDRSIDRPGSVVQTDRADCIRRIIEKPGADEILSDRMALPLYAFQKCFREDLHAIKLSERDEYEIPAAIQNLIDRGGVVAGLESPWRITINNPGEYQAAVCRMLAGDGSIGHQHESDWSRSVEIRNPVYIEDSVTICAGAIIGPYTYLMSGSRIGAHARVQASIVFRGAQVTDGEHVDNKIVLPDVTIDLQRSRDNRGLIHRR
jgi:NDP-sugar pyrophosphorylase family protein